MLIVGREIGQSVIIGDVIKVTIQQYGPKLQLVIDAPEQMAISEIKQNGNSVAKLKKGVRIIGNTILLGDLIKVSLLQTESGLLRIAIDAPKEISIFREELYKYNSFSKFKM